MKRFFLIALFVFAFVLPMLACDEPADPNQDELVQMGQNIQGGLEEVASAAYSLDEALAELDIYADATELLDSVAKVLDVMPEADIQKWAGISYHLLYVDGSRGPAIGGAEAIQYKDSSVVGVRMSDGGIDTSCLSNYPLVVCIAVGNK